MKEQPISRDTYEEMLCYLDRARQTAANAARATLNLEPKISLQRTANNINKARMILLKEIFGIEDASKVSIEKCDSCGSIQP